MDRPPLNDRFNRLPTTDFCCTMTPSTRPDQQKASTVFCCISVILVTASLVVFNVQGSCEWSDRTFEDMWTSISWSFSLKLKIPNLLTFANIARCQCVSTSTCERIFFMQKNIKQKTRNQMTTTHLDSVMRMAIEGPTKNFEFILEETIFLWKDSRNFRFLFTSFEKYLARRIEVE